MTSEDDVTVSDSQYAVPPLDDSPVRQRQEESKRLLDGGVQAPGAQVMDRMDTRDSTDSDDVTHTQNDADTGFFGADKTGGTKDAADALKANCNIHLIGCGLDSFRFRAAMGFKAKRFSLAVMGMLMSPTRACSNCCAAGIVKFLRLCCCCCPYLMDNLDERCVCVCGTWQMVVSVNTKGF